MSVVDTMITGRQIREARHMLGWNSDTLSEKASVSEAIVQDAEVTSGSPDVALFYSMRIQMTLERAGIRFGSNGAVMMLRR